jgi:hypothetical protein
VRGNNRIQISDRAMGGGGVNGAQFLAGGDILSLCHYVQTGSGTHPATYPVGTRCLFPWVKWLGHEADHSPPMSTKNKNAWGYISTPHTSAGCGA